MKGLFIMRCKKCGGYLDNFDESTYYCSNCHEYFNEMDIMSESHPDEIYDDTPEGRRRQKLESLEKLRQDYENKNQYNPNSNIYENPNLIPPPENPTGNTRTPVTLGIVSLVMSIVFSCFSAGISGVISFILALVGLILSTQSKPTNTPGLIINIIALVFSIISSSMFIIFIIGFMASSTY